MTARTKLGRIEERLVDQMAKDRAHPSRRSAPLEDGTVVVRSSGMTCSLALAVEVITGESFDEIMARLAPEVPS